MEMLNIFMCVVCLLVGCGIGYKQGVNQKILLEDSILHNKFLIGHEGLSKLLIDSRDLLSRIYIDLGNIIYSNTNLANKNIAIKIQNEITESLLKTEYKFKSDIQNCDESKKSFLSKRNLILQNTNTGDL